MGVDELSDPIGGFTRLHGQKGVPDFLVVSGVQGMVGMQIDLASKEAIFEGISISTEGGRFLEFGLLLLSSHG